MSKRKLPQRSSHAPSSQGLRQAALRVMDGRITGTGSLVFPCVPALTTAYEERLSALWTLLGRAFTEPERLELRASLARMIALGFEHSPHTLLVVDYEAHPAPATHLTYAMHLKERTVESYYSAWSRQEGGAWFGASADAKVLELARLLAPGARALDVGAGHGRNALPLAQRGLAVDALELVPALCERLRANARDAALPMNVIESDLFADELALPAACYALVVLSELVSHFRTQEQLQVALAKLARALAPDGLLIMNAFLPAPGYAPDRLVREASQVALASVFTPSELGSVAGELGLELLSDESAYEFERANLPAGAWPPTRWFESWATGRNLFDVPAGQSPITLRWLVYRKRQAQPGPAA